MTKKNFIALADALREARLMPGSVGSEPLQTLRGHEQQYTSVVKALADFCAKQSPAFNRQRWLGYVAGKCGPNGGKVAA